MGDVWLALYNSRTKTTILEALPRARTQSQNPLVAEIVKRSSLSRIVQLLRTRESDNTKELITAF
jgi:hypothetical protein